MNSTLDAEALRRHSVEARRVAEDVARLAAAASSDAAGSLHDKQESTKASDDASRVVTKKTFG